MNTLQANGNHMNKIPEALKKEILSDPIYKSCMLYGWHGHICEGRITLEHALRYGGKQVQKKSAICGICAKAHEVDQWQDAGTMNKEMNEWVALNRMTPAEFAEMDRGDFQQRKKYLNGKFGVWYQKFPVDKALEHLQSPAAEKARGPIPVYVPPRTYSLSMKDSVNVKMIRDHCYEAEGIRYSEEKIISLAIEEYAKMIEASRAVSG